MQTVEKIKAAFPNYPLPQLALKWVLMFDAVSCVIPGASKVEQVKSNLETFNHPDLNPTQMDTLKDIYRTFIKPSVHHLW